VLRHAPSLSHDYLAGVFVAGAPAWLWRGDLEPRRDLVFIDTTAYYTSVIDEHGPQF